MDGFELEYYYGYRSINSLNDIVLAVEYNGKFLLLNSTDMTSMARGYMFPSITEGSLVNSTYFILSLKYPSEDNIVLLANSTKDIIWQFKLQSMQQSYSH